MTDQEQINDLACVLDKAKIDALITIGSLNGGFGQWYAKAVYNAGYRKVEDIAEELLNALGNISVGGLVMKLKTYPQFKEICEKYRVEVK